MLHPGCFWEGMGKYIEICSLSKMNGKINKDTDNTYANMYIVQQEKYEVNRLNTWT